MTREEAKGFIQGKLDCMERCDVFDCKGTDECVNCNYCYSQGNFGEQKKAFEMAIESLGNDINVGSKWIPCSERLPKEDGKYLATGIKGSVYIAEFSKGVINGKPVSLWCRSGGHYCNVIAWMELPPAYEGE